MPIGPGKYDHVAKMAREAAKSAGVIVIVIGGEHGDGFSAQCDLPTLGALPDILESVARQMRESTPY